MSFTAQDVAKLREMTGAGMMDCKKALQQTEGNMEEAINFLRQKGIASAAKKAGNIAAEGLLGSAISADKKSAAIVEINSQTDFVAKNEQFQQFVKDVATAALTNKTTTIEALKKAKLASGKTVEEAALELTATIGEKIDVRRVGYLETTGTIGNYVHPVGSKIGVIVALNNGANESHAADLAMHIAAINPAPEYINKSEIPADIIAKEKDIESKKDDLAGKPAEIIDKIVGGRVDKLLATKVLLEQAFIKDQNQKVSAYLGTAVVEAFIRLNLGEGIEKKQEDYAAEVAAAMKV
ncbi:MAG: elongation factor Ts [Cyanobacteriota bacterium]|jgi:elongation factor Ts